MEFSLWQLVTDLGIVSILLLIGVIVRAKVKFVQQLFIPSSIIAGLIGLILGPGGFNLLPFSDQIGSYPEVLIAVVFAALPLLSPKFTLKELVSRVGSMFAYSSILYALMWALSLIFAFIVIRPIWPDMHPGIGIMMATGFGGHGTAAVIGETFAQYGWEDAMTLGMTSATIGLISSIVIGMYFIKRGSEKGEASFLGSYKDIPEEMKTGLIPEEKREANVTETVSTVSIDPFVLQFALVIAITLGGYYVSNLIALLINSSAIPAFSMAFIVGMIVNRILLLTKTDKYFKEQTLDRISGSATDILVVFGIASIQIQVVVEYIWPLVLLFLFGIAYHWFFFKVLAKRFYKKYWFEKGLFSWGWGVGSVAMGIALLRIVDPHSKSRTLDDYGMAYLPQAPIEVLIITFAPIMIVQGQSWLFIAIVIAGCASIYFIARKNNLLNTKKVPS